MNDEQKNLALNKAYQLATMIRADQCKANYFTFFCEFWDVIIPDKLILNWHIKYVCNRLQNLFEKLEQGIPPGDMEINIPPGSSKSTIVTILFPAWCWVRRPRTRIMSGSYAGDIAIEHAVKSRDVMKSEKFQRFWPNLIQFKADMDNKGFYENTERGTRIATSVGGASTGRHADILVHDDALNPKKAASDVERENANNFIDKTFSNRKTDKKLTPIIGVAQRLHEDDPTGRKLSSNTNFEHICLPAEITDLKNVVPSKLRLLYKDGLLDPVRMDREVLDQQRKQLGGIEYGGQFLQSPRDAEGNIFKRDWFRFYTDLPMEQPLRKVQSWDTAYKTKQENDFSVCTEWFEYKHGYYLTNFFEGKLEYTQLKDKIKVLYQKTKPHWVLIEDKSSGQSAIQELSLLNLPLKAINPIGDKILRANQVTPPFESKNVYFPIKDFTDKIIEQMTGFPNTKNDDIVDSITQFLNFARESNASAPIIASAGRRKSESILRGYNAKIR